MKLNLNAHNLTCQTHAIQAVEYNAKKRMELIYKNETAKISKKEI